MDKLKKEFNKIEDGFKDMVPSQFNDVIGVVKEKTKNLPKTFQKKVEGEEGNDEEGYSEEHGEIMDMKDGDYMIHIHVQSAKQLILDDEVSFTPFISASILGVTKQTQAKKSSSKVIFDEHIFFEFKDLKKEQIIDSAITLQAENKGFFKQDIIGTFKISTQRIYNMDRHAMLHQTIGINNPDLKDFNKVTGYITVSIDIITTGDEAIQLNMGTEQEIAEHKPLMPLNIKKTYKQLYFKIFRAEHLPVMDSVMVGEGSTDAYLHMSYSGQTLKSKVVQMKQDKVEWNQTMLIPIELPIREENIKFKVYDHDYTIDELVCSFELSVRDLLMETERKVRWIDLYGPKEPRKLGKFVDRMLQNPTEGSTWLGRIQVLYYVQDRKYPELGIKNLDNLDLVARKQFETSGSKEFKIYCQFGEAISLPGNKPYTLMLKIGPNVISSGKPKYSKNRSCIYYSSFQEEWFDSLESINDFPDIFIYLMDEDSPICFRRDKVQNFMDSNIPVKWLEFEPDRAVGQVYKPYKSGFFSIKLFITSVGEFSEADPCPAWSEMKQSSYEKYRVRVNIYQCMSLPPADQEGHSDPYVEVYNPYDSSKKDLVHTKVIHDTNNPIFYEVKEIFQEQMSNKESMPPIILNVWDIDIGPMGAGNTRNFMCRAVVFPKYSDSDKIPTPEWIPLKVDQDEDHGEDGPMILCSFQRITYQNKFSIAADSIFLDKLNPRLQMPDLQIQEFKCQVLVLGLRNLVSHGVLPIRKAYIKFNLKSLLSPEKASAIENIQTMPQESGPNPSIKASIDFEVRLPSDPLFVPIMGCDVYDQLYFSGVAQPHLGTFKLKMGEIFMNQQQKYRNQVKGLDQLIDLLEKISSKSGVQLSRIIQEEIDMEDIILDNPHLKSLKSSIQREFSLDPSNLRNVSDLRKRKGKNPRHPQGNYKERVEIMKKMEDQQNSMKVGIRGELVNMLQNDQWSAKQKLKEKRKQDQKNYQCQSAYFNVIKPHYKYNERLKIDTEFNIPPDSLFMQIGYDTSSSNSKKHYRRYYLEDLEKCKDEDGKILFQSPFLSEDIKRAKIKNKSGIFGKLFDRFKDKQEENQTYNCGKFKGIVKCYPESEIEKLNETISEKMKRIYSLIESSWQNQYAGQRFDFDWDSIDPLIQDDYKDIQKNLMKLKNEYTDKAGMAQLKLFHYINEYIYDQYLTRQLQETKKARVRLYVLEGFNFAKRDLFSLSDPYLIIKCGKQIFNEQKNYQMDISDPKFYKVYEFSVEFPSAHPIEIDAYDYNQFFGDDLIGSTVIDLDDRFFSHDWKSMDQKPIEQRDLYHPSSTLTQGAIKLWLEIDGLSQQEYVDIQPQPEELMEMRLIIWQTKDLELKDWEGMSDIYVKAFMDGQKEQLTDTHWRCQGSTGSFNYRLLLPVASLKKQYLLTIQAWDKDIFSSDELLGEAQIDVTAIVNDCLVTKRQWVLSKDYFKGHMKDEMIDPEQTELANRIQFEDMEKFWVPVKLGDNNDAGKILCSLRILPKEAAEMMPQGKGRNHPNDDPHLAEPAGRFQLTWNPYMLLHQLVGGMVLRRLIALIALIVFSYLCFMMTPMIFANIITG